MRERPTYSISTMADLLDVHPETLRVWERHELLKPARRRGQRCYTDADLQRLLFIRHLIDRWGLNLSGVEAYIRLYPCWQNDRCPSVQCTGTQIPHAKPCWRRPQSHCASTALGSEPCGSCNQHNHGDSSGTHRADVTISVSAAAPEALCALAAAQPESAGLLVQPQEGPFVERAAEP